MVGNPSARARSQAELQLLALRVLESMLLRWDRSGESDRDAELRAGIVAELCAAREADGSWQGSALRTAEMLLQVAELADPTDAAVRQQVAPSVAWLVRRQDRPGRFGGTCDAWHHELGMCVHAVTGFYALAPLARELSGLRLANGARFVSDEDARIGGSALALAATLTWGVCSTEQALHVDALVRLLRLDDRDRTALISTNTLCCIMLALLADAADAAAARTAFGAHAGAALRDAASILARTQRADGSWPDSDLYFVLNVVVRISASRPALEPILAPVLRRAASMLVLLQQPDGGWGRGTTPYQLLAGARALRAAGS